MFKKLPIWLTAPVLFLAVFLILCVGGWLIWFNTRPVYDARQWAGITSTSPKFVLYLFDATPSNAVHTLRDSLTAELARSRKLPPNYPKLHSVPWTQNISSCQSKNFITEERYFIQLSDVTDNYIEIPLCAPTAMDHYLVIYVLSAWPWAQVNYTTPQIFIGMVRNGNPEKQHQLLSGQRELILESLKNAGVKLYLDEYFEDLLNSK